MSERKETALASSHAARDPFAMLRDATSELDRIFGRPFGSALRWPSLRAMALPDAASWTPQVDVFERGNRLITKVDLPGVKKDDVKVEVTDGHLAISGERKSESDEKKDNVYRCERSYGSFYRAVPLPEGVMLEDVKASFANGVLEVSIPLPAPDQAKVRTVEIEDAPKAATPAKT